MDLESFRLERAITRNSASQLKFFRLGEQQNNIRVRQGLLIRSLPPRGVRPRPHGPRGSNGVSSVRPRRAEGREQVIPGQQKATDKDLFQESPLANVELRRGGNISWRRIAAVIMRMRRDDIANPKIVDARSRYNGVNPAFVHR